MSLMIYNHSAETMPLEKLRLLQDERLRQLVLRLYQKVPFYRQLFDARGIIPNDIKGIGDLPMLPLTSKLDLRDHYPYGLFATPMEEVRRIEAGELPPFAIHREDLASFAISGTVLCRVIALKQGDELRRSGLQVLIDRN